MSDTTTGNAFRYSRVMAWAPPIILVLGLLAIVSDQLYVGILLAVVAIVFWIVVRRRRRGA
jgi:hypothetical protein